MSEYNNQESSSCNNLMQVEDKVFKGIMIFNLIRMGLSAGLILLTFKELMLLMTNGYLFYGLLSIGTVVLCLGIAIGTAIGVATDSLAIYMPIGLSIGMCFGSLIDAQKRKKAKDSSADEEAE